MFIVALLIVWAFILLVWLIVRKIPEEKNDTNSSNYFIKKYSHLENEYQIKLSRNNENKVSISIDFNDSITKEPCYLVVDIETTGLPPRTDVNKSNYARFPRIVQIAWIILDKDFNKVSSHNHIIKQTKEIEYESILIHGITDEIAEKEGEDISLVLDWINADLKKCEFLVAHNVLFDYNIIKSEMYRNKKEVQTISEIRQICTMFQSKFFCKIPFKNNSQEEADKYYQYKNPKLTELVKKCFFTDWESFYISGMHNAYVDVVWTCKCLQKLVMIEKIKPECIIYPNKF